ncbi:hypothetical protein LXL04_032646 [Taraxacum kok-saghyz]
MTVPISRKRKLDVEDDELLILLSEQRRELTAAITADSDFDFAFQLQVQEAIKVSLTSQPSSSSFSSHQSFLLLNEVTDAPSGIAHLVAEEIDSFERERSDRAVVEAEARDIKAGDNFEKPYGLSSSSIDEALRVYFKGLMSDETVMNAKMTFAGIGVAICDTNDCCVFELRKPYLLGGNEGEGDLVELKALIEALNTAVTLGLRRVHIFCDSNSSYQYLTGKGRPTNNSSLTLIDDLNVIQRKFAYCIPFIVEQENGLLRLRMKIWCCLCFGEEEEEYKNKGSDEELGSSKQDDGGESRLQPGEGSSKSSSEGSTLEVNLNLSLGGESSSSSAVAVLERDGLDRDSHSKRPKARSLALGGSGLTPWLGLALRFGLTGRLRFGTSVGLGT